MKYTKFIALLLVLLMLMSSVISCTLFGEEQESDTSEQTDADSQSESLSESQSEEDEDEEEIETIISMSGVIATEGLTGDINAFWKPEGGEENVITGAEQAGVPYAIYGAMASPTVISKVVFTAPTEEQALAAAATVDASADGVNWVNLTTIGNVVVSNKVYSINVKDTAEYLYVRVRQSEEAKNQAFRLRTVVVKGYAKSGVGGDISNIVPETDPSKLITMKSYLVSSTKKGEPANVFLDNDSSWIANKSSSGVPNYLWAVMAKKTEITKIEVKLWGSNRQARGTVIQGSVDGGTWVDLCTIPDLMQDGVISEMGEFTFVVNDTTQFSFVRAVQRADLANYDWTLNTILVYGVESEEDAAEVPRKFIDAEWVYAEYEDSYVDTHRGSVESVFDVSDTTTEYVHKEHPNLEERVEYWISAKLAGPTVITEITYYAPASGAERARSSYFEASVDGVNWVKIAELPGKTIASSAVIKLGVNDDTEYSYVRLVQGVGFFKYYWNVGTVSITGVCDTPNPDVVAPPAAKELIDVTPKSKSENYHDPEGDPIAWDRVWTKGSEARLVCLQRDAIEIVGEFAEAKQIGSVEVKAGYYSSRAVLFTLSASVDGESWTTIKAFSDIEVFSNPQNTQYALVTFDIEDTTAYKYVRLSIDGAEENYWAELYYVAFFGVEAE